MPDSVCPQCGGSGWVVVERGGISGAERCECGLAERPARLEERAGIPPLYRNASLDNFLLPTDDPAANRALANVLLSVRRYVREFPATDKPGLLFIGDPGTGKTHLAVAALRMLLARGFEGLFFDYQNLLDRIRAGYDPASGATDREAYRSALETEILLLDDLGAHRVTDWVEDTVTSIITYRCNHRKPLIATTNLRDPDAGDPAPMVGLGGELSSRYYLSERIGMRARSRLFEMCKVIRMPVTEDYRLRKTR
ncbi:MAG: ATP-binding protein [Bryobacterales bacterium]|nr:ATP-binding protein [Bryobacteraceae bacterium]MDW8354609.1 ATP-binding protein [Bryobacterales bacterium]